MHFYPHNIGDFNNATRHLTRVERSVYRDAIDLYYDSESVLTLDISKLAKRLLCHSDDEIQALKSILSEYFTMTEEGYRHERCEIEIKKYRDNTSAKARAGIASAAKRKQNSTHVEQMNNGCATKQETINKKQETINNKKEKSKEITFPEFLQICKDKNELPIPADDSIYGWADKVKLPQDMLVIAWNAFKSRTWKDAKGKEKKYSDWRKAFRQYCENPDWLDVWSINRDGEFYLTPKGKLLERELNE